MLADLRRALADAGLDLLPLVRALLDRPADGRIKLYTTMMALHYRRAHRALFQSGEYIPLDGQGSRREHLCAFARLREEQATVTVVPRLAASLTEDSIGPPVGFDPMGGHPGGGPLLAAGFSVPQSLHGRDVGVPDRRGTADAAGGGRVEGISCRSAGALDMKERDKRASSPFRFVSCMELREVLGKEAMDEQRLLELIEEVPGDSIYYHTHSYYLRNPYAQRLFPNDFATWVTLFAQYRKLGERLGVLPTRLNLKTSNSFAAKSSRSSGII